MINCLAAHSRATARFSSSGSRLVIKSIARENSVRQASSYRYPNYSLQSFRRDHAPNSLCRPHGTQATSSLTCRRASPGAPLCSPVTSSPVWFGQSTRGFSIMSRCLKENSPEDGKDKQTPPPATSNTPAKSAAAVKEAFKKVLPLASLTPHENIYTVPNLLTFSRLIVAPVIGYAILHDAHVWALGLFAYAGFSDLLDGWIARKWNLQTVVGSVVDPMADKLLMTILTVCLATQGSLPVWLAVIILGRDVGLAISAIYYRWISLPPPKTFMRYWDFSLPSAEVHPTTISKYNTFLQLGLMGATMTAPVVATDVGVAMTGLQYLVATTTVWSGASYIYSKDAVKILSQEDGEKKKEKKKKEEEPKNKS